MQPKNIRKKKGSCVNIRMKISTTKICGNISNTIAVQSIQAAKLRCERYSLMLTKDQGRIFEKKKCLRNFKVIKK